MEMPVKSCAGKTLSAAYGENLTWSKVLDIVNNLERTAQSMQKFHQTPTQLRTDQLTTKREGHRPGSNREKQWMSGQRKETSKPCFRCLGTRNSQQTCRYKELQRRACLKTGHLKRACRGRVSAGNRAFSKQRCQTAHCNPVKGTRYLTTDHVARRLQHSRKSPVRKGLFTVCSDSDSDFLL